MSSNATARGRTRRVRRGCVPRTPPPRSIPSATSPCPGNRPAFARQTVRPPPPANRSYGRVCKVARIVVDHSPLLGELWSSDLRSTTTSCTHALQRRPPLAREDDPRSIVGPSLSHDLLSLSHALHDPRTGSPLDPLVFDPLVSDRGRDRTRDLFGSPRDVRDPFFRFRLREGQKPADEALCFFHVCCRCCRRLGRLVHSIFRVIGDVGGN